MITDNEKFIEIQAILVSSNINTRDCAKINDLIIELSKENQELKEKLDKYENPEDMTLMMMWCTEKVKDENEKLMKQLEDTEKCLKDMFHINIENDEELDKLKTQQKEFINYLEDEKDRLIKETSHYYIDSFDRQHSVNETIYDEVNDILQKYKEYNRR